MFPSPLSPRWAALGGCLGADGRRNTGRNLSPCKRLGDRLRGMLVSQPHGHALSHSIVKPFWSDYPSQEVPGGGAVAGVPALRGKLHKPCFSGKAAKNSQGRCATGCTLPVPGLFYIAAALGLGPRARTVPGGEGWGWGGGTGQDSREAATTTGLRPNAMPCALHPFPPSCGPRWVPAWLPRDPQPSTHIKRCLGMSVRSEEVTRRIEAFSVSLSLVRGFAL